MNRNKTIRQQRPFGAIPDAGFYFPHPSIQSAFDTVVRAMYRAEGPVAVLGGAGYGKSLLIELVSENLCERMDVVKLQSARICSRQALLQNILYELQLPYRSLSEGELRLSILDRLEPSPETAPDGILIVVDEAQTLHPKLLDELRLLTNFSRNNQVRVRLMLVGNMKLEESLANPQLDSLNQRLAARCYLQPMNGEETADYVRHQLRVAGQNPNSCITPDALRAVFSASDGIPRLVNQIMDHALVLASSQAKELVTSDLISESWAELQQLPAPWVESKHDSKMVPVGSPIEFGTLEDSVDSADFPSDSILQSLSRDLPQDIEQFVPEENHVDIEANNLNDEELPEVCVDEACLSPNFFAAFTLNDPPNCQILLPETKDHAPANAEINEDESAFSAGNRCESMEIWENDPPLHHTKHSAFSWESQPGAIAESEPNSLQLTEEDERTQELFGDDFDLELSVPIHGRIPSVTLPDTDDHRVQPDESSGNTPMDYLARMQETADTLTQFSQFSEDSLLGSDPTALLNPSIDSTSSPNPATAPTGLQDPQWSISVGADSASSAVEDSIEDIVSQLNFSAFMVEPFSVEQIPLYPNSQSSLPLAKAENSSDTDIETPEGIRLNAQQQVLMLHRPIEDGQLFTGIEEFDDDRDLLIIEEHVAPSSQHLYQNLPSEPTTKPTTYNQLFSRLRK